jgi:hypothetical protein
MDMQNRNRAARVRRVEHHPSGNGSDRRDPIGHLGGQPIRHHRPVGMTRGVDPGRIDRRPAGEVTQECNDESDAVYTPISCIAAAGSGVPGQELPGQAAGTLGKNQDESLSIGDSLESVMLAHPLSIPPTAVKGQDHRPRSPSGTAGRNVDKVISFPPAMLHLELIVS